MGPLTSINVCIWPVKAVDDIWCVGVAAVALYQYGEPRIYDSFSEIVYEEDLADATRAGFTVAVSRLAYSLHRAILSPGTVTLSSNMLLIIERSFADELEGVLPPGIKAEELTFSVNTKPHPAASARARQEAAAGIPIARSLSRRSNGLSTATV